MNQCPKCLTTYPDPSYDIELTSHGAMRVSDLESFACPNCGTYPKSDLKKGQCPSCRIGLLELTEQPKLETGNYAVNLQTVLVVEKKCNNSECDYGIKSQTDIHYCVYPYESMVDKEIFNLLNSYEQMVLTNLGARKRQKLNNYWSKNR